MRFSTTALVLGTLAAGQASAATMTHGHMTGKRHNHAARHAEMMQRAGEQAEVEKRAAAGALIGTLGTKLLSSMQIATPINGKTNDPLHAKVSSEGQWLNTFYNNANEDLVLFIWGPMGSWINAAGAQLAVEIPKNGSSTVSFPNGWSGAWAPLYSSATQTNLRNGQIHDTWGEATFNEWATADVSREPNMNGRNMKIVTPQCTSSMDQCVFKCNSPDQYGQCTYDYALVNCDIGSQPGANYGKDPVYGGAPTGGCSGMGKSAHLQTYLG